MSRLAIQISVAAAFLIIVVFSAEPNLNLKTPYGGDDYECQRFGGTVVVCVEKRTKPKANPKPTEPKANPMPTKPKANPKPMEPKANPKPMEPKANPKPTGLEPTKPYRRCSNDDECKSKICQPFSQQFLSNPYDYLPTTKPIRLPPTKKDVENCTKDCEEENQTNKEECDVCAKDCEKKNQTNKKKCDDCKKNDCWNERICHVRNCTEDCRYLDVNICLDKFSGENVFNGTYDAVGQGYLPWCNPLPQKPIELWTSGQRTYTNNMTLKCERCCSDSKIDMSSSSGKYIHDDERCK